MVGGSVEVQDELSDGIHYADRHTVHVIKKDGSTVRMEVYLFGGFAPDGRFSRMEEVTLMLEGADADRDGPSEASVPRLKAGATSSSCPRCGRERAGEVWDRRAA